MSKGIPLTNQSEFFYAAIVYFIKALLSNY